MGDRRQITVLYGEKMLQKTISLHASATVADAKKFGSDEILQRIHLQRGVPAISLDDECIDFYPAASDNTLIRDLKEQATIVVWPAPAPGSTLTPSPIIDALSSALTEVEKLRAQCNVGATIKQESTKKKRKPRKPGPSSIPTSDSSDASTSDKTASKPIDTSNVGLLERLATLEAHNASLQESLTAVKIQLEGTNAVLQTTMHAILTDCDEINNIRSRVLLDLGRDKLAVICGYTDWANWTASTNSREAMVNSVSTQLNAVSAGDVDMPRQWIALGNQPTALQMLLSPDRVRCPGDITSQASQKLIGKSVLAQTVEQDRNDMIAIFRAVYGAEPVH